MSIFLTTEYVPITCGGCGVQYAHTKAFNDQKKKDHTGWTCPNGCNRAYLSESNEEKLQRQLNQANQNRAYLEDRIREEQAGREAAQHQARAYKGHTTRIKNRVSKGVCPCCNRSFSNLARHMESQHKGYNAEEIAA